MVDIPDFYTDKYYKPTQEKMFDYGEDILAGDIPDYYADIGRAGGPAFQRMQERTTANVREATQEGAAARGVGRSGIVDAATAGAVADTSAKLGWQDFLRSIQGKQNLLSAGLNTMSGVRGAGLQYGGQKNRYNINKANLEFQEEQLEAQEEAAEQAMWGDLIGAGIGAVGNIASMGMMGGFDKIGKLLGGGAAGGGGAPGFSAYDTLSYGDIY